MDAPYFPFYPADWLADPNVEFMTLEEQGAYIRLLSHMWREEGCSLPDDDKFLARLLHVSARKWNSLRKILIDGDHAVLANKSDGRLHNNRLDKEYEKVVKTSGSRSNAAKSRWNKVSPEDVRPMQMQSKSNANASDLHMQNDAISDLDPDPDSQKDKEPTTTTTRVDELAQLVDAYQKSGFGQADPMFTMQALEADLEEFGFEWTIEAMRRAVKRGKRTLGYVEAVLKDWRANGGIDDGEGDKSPARIRGQSRVDRSQAAEADERYANFYKQYPGSGRKQNAERRDSG